MEKVSELIIKGKLRLHQLAGIDPAEIIMAFTAEEIKKSYGKTMNPGKVLVLIFWGEISSNYPKSDRLNLTKRISLILP